ncbi:hypothetical protein [Mycetocola sp.]|uniref:hypothetical protein n=1 Tax=Mycetocola sp. TaxID=1871042 RepID=UPI003989CE82
MKLTMPAAHIDAGGAIVLIKLVKQSAFSCPTDAGDSDKQSCMWFRLHLVEQR